MSLLQPFFTSCLNSNGGQYQLFRRHSSAPGFIPDHLSLTQVSLCRFSVQMLLSIFTDALQIPCAHLISLSSSLQTTYLLSSSFFAFRYLISVCIPFKTIPLMSKIQKFYSFYISSFGTILGRFWGIFRGYSAWEYGLTGWKDCGKVTIEDWGRNKERKGDRLIEQVGSSNQTGRLGNRRR